MSELYALHPDQERLQSLADGELAAREVKSLRRHTDACEKCRGALDAIRRAGDEYARYHQTLKALDPAPPEPWADLSPRLGYCGTRPDGRGSDYDNRHFPPTHPSRDRQGAFRSSRPWLAAAAALLIAIALYYRVTRPAPVSAAALLQKAAQAQPAPNPAARIRVRTKNRNVLRPAVLTKSSEPALESLFLAAHFSWQGPLSARSFAAWRDQLPQKEDRVRTSPGAYEIRTTTQAGPLTEAVLVLDAHDLHAVSETLQFTDETVEISTAEPAVAAPEPVAPAPAPTESLPVPAVASGPAQELRAIAALHAIGADLGEPVQVSRENGTLIVEATGLTPARQQQVRDAMSSIPSVTLRFDPPDAAPLSAPAGGRIATAAGVRTQLEARFGEDGVNRILDASEAVMARVYAMRGLSRRFPQAVEPQLVDADRGVLATIRSEHAIGLRMHLRGLESVLAPLLPKLPPSKTSPAPDWRDRVERVFVAAKQVDSLLTRILGGGEDFAVRAPELAEALRRLDEDVAVL